MKQILGLLMIFTLCSCEQTNTAVGSEDNTPKDSSASSNTATNDKTIESENTDTEKNQEALRSDILKGNFLKEMYAKNVVTLSNDSLHFNISFDLHSADCGAPDCYSNDLSFSFGLGDKLVFPKSIDFKEHEHGCVDRESKLSGNFQLVEETPKHVIYHSDKHKSTLVLFSSNKETGTSAFYFSGVDQKRINGKNVYRIMKDYNDDDKNAVYPFTSRALR